MSMGIISSQVNVTELITGLTKYYRLKVVRMNKIQLVVKLMCDLD